MPVWILFLKRRKSSRPLNAPILQRMPEAKKLNFSLVTDVKHINQARTTTASVNAFERRHLSKPPFNFDLINHWRSESDTKQDRESFSSECVSCVRARPSLTRKKSEIYIFV